MTEALWSLVPLSQNLPRDQKTEMPAPAVKVF